jgi:hypothetical protein
MIGTALQAIGLVAFVVAGFVVSLAVGFAVLGAACVCAGFLLEFEEVRRGSSSTDRDEGNRA